MLSKKGREAVGGGGGMALKGTGQGGGGEAGAHAAPSAHLPRACARARTPARTYAARDAVFVSRLHESPPPPLFPAHTHAAGTGGGHTRTHAYTHTRARAPQAREAERLGGVGGFLEAQGVEREMVAETLAKLREVLLCVCVCVFVIH